MVKSEWNANDFNTVLECCLFHGCGEADVRAYLNTFGVNVYDFSGGEEIPNEWRIRRWAVVVWGAVKIFSGGEDGSVLLNVVGRGDIFDVAALTGRQGNPPPSTVITAGKCRILFVTACDIETLMREHPKIAANCFGVLTERIGFLNRRIHTLTCGSAENRLADFLLNECYQKDGSLLVKLNSYVELSNRLGMSRTSLYRALGTLEKSGAIVRSGKRITILDRERLQSY